MNKKSAKKAIKSLHERRLTTTSGIAVIAICLSFFSILFTLDVYQSNQDPKTVLGASSSPLLAEEGISGSEEPVTPSINEEHTTPTPIEHEGTITEPTNLKEIINKVVPSTIQDERPSVIPSPSIPQHLFVKPIDEKSEVDLNANGTHITFDNTTHAITIQKPDGTSANIQDSIISSINDELKQKGIAISQEGINFSIVQNGVSADSDKPLSVDLSTHNIEITTAQGPKSLNILPSDAINNLTSKNIINTVSVDPTTNKQDIKITTDNNEPVFQVNGIVEKKLLGFIPVQLQKDVTVSAQTGNIKNVNESFIMSLLDHLSF